jgi:hypothetical protein
MGGRAYAPRLQTKASDEKAFATTFASCRDQVRAGKTADFKLSSAGPSARDLKPGDTGLTLKVPYDKAKGGSRASRMAQDTAHKASMDRCLGENGYASGRLGRQAGAKLSPTTKVVIPGEDPGPPEAPSLLRSRLSAALRPG